MSIRYLKLHDIDFEKWDKCIDNAFNGIIYGYSWYLNKTSHYWDGLIEGDYESVMPLPCKKKMGINYIYQPAFVQQLGVFSIKPITDKLLSDFIEAIPEKFKYIEYNLNISNNIPHGKNYKVITNQTFELSLNEKYETLKGNYSNNIKRNIKKAEKSNLFITYNSAPEPIIQLFQKNKGKTLGTVSKKEYDNLKHLSYYCLHKGITQIHSVYSDMNSLCAGMIMVRSHRRIIFLFSGADEKARKTGAMSLLIDDFIRKNSGLPYILDFEGSNHPGTAKFYKSFGSVKRTYQRLKINRLPWILKSIFSIYKTGKSLFLRFVKT